MLDCDDKIPVFYPWSFDFGESMHGNEVL